MTPATITRRTVRLYAFFAAVAAALGIGIALGADHTPHQDDAPVAAAVQQPQQAQPSVRTGQS